MRIVGSSALFVGLVLVSGCDKAKEGPDAGPSSGEVAQKLGIDASALSVDPSDPVAPAGNLREEAERFSTLETCVAERAKVDPLLGDAIRAIGYDTLFFDGCRVLQATKDRDAHACEPIVSSALRARCETLVAIARADGEGCPRVRETSVVRGRSPTCLAAATGDARLCQGEPPLQRIHCEALVMRDERRCEWLPDDLKRPGMGKRSCLRELTRLRAMLPEAKVALPPLVAPKAELEVSLSSGEARVDDAGAAEPGDAGASRSRFDATSEVAQGLVIFPAYARREVFDRSRLGMEIGSVSDTQPVFVASAPTRAPRLAVFVSFAKGGGDARIERLELDLPGARSHTYPGERFRGQVTLSKVGDVRGAEVSFTVRGELYENRIAVALTGTTFLRDVVTEVPASLPSPLLAAPHDRDSGTREPSPWLSRDAGALLFRDAGP